MIVLGSPFSSVGKESACSAGDPGWEDSLRRKWQPTPVCLSGKSHGQRSLVGWNPWGREEAATTEGLTHTHMIVLLKDYSFSHNLNLNINVNALQQSIDSCYLDSIYSFYSFALIIESTQRTFRPYQVVNMESDMCLYAYNSITWIIPNILVATFC